MDYGFHPPTIYFPLVVPEALMIEPTETEPKETLDAFVDAMLAIAREAADDPETAAARRRTTRPVAASTRCGRRSSRSSATAFEEHPDPNDDLVAQSHEVPSAVSWTKEALGARVDELGLGDELLRFAATLDDDERERLQEVLLERSGAEDYALRERLDAKGWLRRQSGPQADPGSR